MGMYRSRGLLRPMVDELLKVFRNVMRWVPYRIGIQGV